MSDNEIQILIRAVDETSTTVKQIQDNLANSFTKMQGNLMLLGNTALQVDDIFDSYDNLQLRLENSTEKVANAQDRLTKAQWKLNEEQLLGKGGADGLASAQMELDAASRGLTISQNNLAKTNNAVIGTYITIGMHVLSITASLPATIAAVWGLVTSFGALTIAGAPVWAVLLAIIAAVAAGYLIWKNWDMIIKTLADSFLWLWGIIKKVWDILTSIVMSPVKGLINTMASLFGGGKSASNAKGSGNNYTFNIDKVSGTDPNDMMEAFQRDLNKKINL